MADRRFHVEDLTPPVVALDLAQARHATTVLRLAVGDCVTLFDGKGVEASGRIESIAPAGVTIRISERSESRSASTPDLVMAVSPPKGNRADWLVEKLAEIGVKRLVPLQTERTVVAPGDAKLVRWRRKCVEAAKQARRAVVMEVVGAATLADVLSTAAQGTDLLFGDAAATTPTLVEHLLDRGGDATAQSRAAMFLIGPEGGFTPDETAAMTRAGARAVRLNDGVLRIETAAIVAATIWRAHALRHAERPPNPRSTRNSSV